MSFYRICTLVFLSAMLLTGAASANEPVVGWEVAANELVKRVDSGQVSARDCRPLAEDFGDIVARGRELETDLSQLRSTRELGERLHKACREGIRELEAAAGEDERALETLYRSDFWYQVNRALAALRYWQAWLDLALVQRNTDKEERLTDLYRAERGFEAAALRILYPGLVYGSWLGLAYVAQLQDDEATARQRLTLLKQALAADVENPLHEIIDTELGLIALRSGEKKSVPILPGQQLTASLARLLEELVQVLLTEQREYGKGAIEAAQHLKQLVAQGFLDDRLLARILNYRDEIAGHDIGLPGFLVDAEYAYAYQQYETTVLKFRQFILEGGEQLPLVLDLFRYHFAHALYEIDLPRDALAEIQRLLEKAQLAPVLRSSLFKLNFIVAESMYLAQSSDAHTSQLQAAAETLIANSPADPDIASAHLALARVVDDDGTRAAHLESASMDRRLRADIRAVELEIALAEFHRSLTIGDGEARRSTAAEVLRRLDGLPRKQRDTLGSLVLALQLRTVIGDDPVELMKEADLLAEDPELNSTQRRVLIWSRLRLLDRSGGPAPLRDFVADLPPAGTDAALNQELYAILREFEDLGRREDVARLSQLWLPKLSLQPQLQRQVWLMRITALSASGSEQEALAETLRMVETFPRSGDAWRRLAEISESIGDSFAAERAWMHIATAEAEGSDRWLEASLHRLQILVMSEPETARECSLRQRLQVYNQRLNEQDKEVLQALVEANACFGLQKEH